MMPKSPASSQRKAVKPAPKPKAKAGPPKKPTLGGAVPLPDVPRLGMQPGMPQPPAMQTGPSLGMGHMANASNPLGSGQAGGLQPTVRGTMPPLSPRPPVSLPTRPAPRPGTAGPLPAPPTAPRKTARPLPKPRPAVGAGGKGDKKK